MQYSESHILSIRNTLGVLTVILWGYLGSRHMNRLLNLSYIIPPAVCLALDIMLGFSDIPGAKSFLLWAGVDVWMIHCGINGLRKQKPSKP